MVVDSMEVTSDSMLKPYRPSPPSPPHHPLFNTEVRLTIFDRAAFDLHVPILYAFRPPMPDNRALKDGLSRALFHFPHLAGRLSADRTSVFLNDAGIRLIETTIAAPLEDYLPLSPSSGRMLSRLHPPLDGGEELQRIQLNRFSCGGLVIGQTAHHRVADGQSMNSFFVAWARAVRGVDLGPLPYHDRGAISVPRNPPTCEHDHRRIEFREEEGEKKAPADATGGDDGSGAAISNLVVHFSGEFMSKLKARFAGDRPGRRYSTFQCLLTHLWKKITVSRGLREGEVSQVRVAVNGRARMRPRVPMEYFGNLVLWAYPKMTAGELLRESYVAVADAIHEAISAVDDGYFRSFVDFGELRKGEEALVATAPETGNSLCPNLEVDSWLSFQFHDLDFGGGPPSSFLPPNLPVEGLMVLVPASDNGGGVDVFMALLPEHVEAFRQICHSLD